MATTLGQAPAYCDDNEFQVFSAPPNQSCADYMREYISTACGFLRDPQATSECHYCRLNNTDQFLRRIHARWETRWRDFGILWVYVAFNVAGAMFFYWLCRVPRVKKVKKS
jgi:ATP-binding cassette subfamily G (WHITE) protein 2 (PDR)